MSLELAAKHLASKGRGPDSMLVHMAPREVAGLQALAKAHGGSLTVNPHTGLPEAGFLSSILPMVAGAGLMAMGVPSPWMAGMLVGGGTALASGNLMKGISAGLGAWGGAGIGEGLMAAGADSAAAAAVDPIAKAPVAGATENAIGGGLKPTLPGAVDASPVLNNYSVGNGTAFGGGESGLRFGTGEQLRFDPSLPKVETVTQAPAIEARNAEFIRTADDAKAAFNNQPFYDKLQQGTTALGTEGGRAVALEKMGGGWGASKYGLAALSPVIANSMQRGAPRYAGSGPNPYNFTFHRGPVTPTPMPDPTGREQRYYNSYFTPYAEGGSTSPMPDPTGREQRYAVPQLQAIDPRMAQQPEATGGLFSRLLAQLNRPEYAFAQAPMVGVTNRAEGGPIDAMSDQAQAQTLMANGGQMYAQGGMSHLGDYSDGGRLLRGPGDGVSDSIPADIEGKRPARLADGEFVVPARIVSELGNGSTEAGARKLYAMMDRVQAARRKSIGKDKVAVNSKAEKLLPA